MTETKEKTTEELDKEIDEARAALNNVHGSECEVYARIVGYYRAVKNWNKGKKEEYAMRATFNTDNEPQKRETALHCAPSPVALDADKGEHFELYFRETCPACPAVKSYMQGVNMTGRSINVDTDAGLKEAAEKGVFAAPTVIFYNKAGQETARCHTTEELAGIVASAA